VTKKQLADLLFLVWQKERVPGAPSCRLKDAPKDMRTVWEAVAQAAIDVLPKAADAIPKAVTSSIPAVRRVSVTMLPKLTGEGWKPTR
jgi:hypothetical protein